MYITFDYCLMFYLFVVTNLKLCLESGMNSENKTKRRQIYKEKLWVLVMAFLIYYKEKNQLLLYTFTYYIIQWKSHNSVFVTFFNFFCQNINYKFRCASAHVYTFPHLFIFYKYFMCIKWYMDQMIECKQWQNWKATL